MSTDTSNKSKALNYLINLLARREYSEFEIRHKMQEKQYSPAEIDHAVHTCQQHNWQNDQRFTENYILSRSQKGYGVTRIRQELSQLKGISSITVEQALEEINQRQEINWQNIALQLLRKKFPKFQHQLTPSEKQKIWRYMQSHGFRSADFSKFIGKMDYIDEEDCEF